MKKFLFLVLFALILGSISADLTDEWEKAKQVVKKAVEWLQSKGLFDDLVNFLRKHLRNKAQELCESKFSKKLCNNIIEWLINAIERELLD